ncbi:MAG: helix-turn-helix transcriptional regulator [Armatimonadetes bacterium]|nr:helix-turn-helix transcriptional regulator [Armatimonadota bacterium]
MFKALGDPTRLRIFEFLRTCAGPVAVGEEGEVRPVEGPTVGEVCCQVTGADKITSTVSFHLKELRNAGLISMEKRGKNMICSIDGDAVRRLADYLDGKRRDGSDCCEG